MKQSFKTGIIFTAIGKFSNLFVSLIVNAILSRILSPGDYGVVAIVQVFILFFQILVEAGMGPAIIQNKKLTQKEIGVLFNYSVILAIVLSVGFGLFGYILSFIYQNTIYIAVSWVESLAVLFSGLNVVPSALLNKEKRFKEINFNQIIGSFLSGICGVILAFNGFGVYSLVFSAIVLSGTVLIRNLLASHICYQKNLDKSVLNKILGFSVHQFSFNFINYFSRNADNILVGKFMGASALGNYSKAYQLLMMPNSILLGIINPVLQPILSDYQDDVLVIRNEYMKIVRLLALIGFPLSAFLSINAKDIIFFMFGKQWGDAIFPFKVLALTVWIQMTLSSTGAIFQARNKAKELFTTGLMSAFILVGGIVVGIFTNNLNHFSIILTGAFYLNYFVNFHRVMKLALNSNLVFMLKEIGIPALFGVVEYVALMVVYSFLSIKSSFISLLVMGIIFILIFLVLAIVTGEWGRQRRNFKG